MLNYSSIETDFDAKLLSLSPRVVRSVRERSSDGRIVEYPELQFQATNVSNSFVAGIEVEVNYYLQSGEFAGTDSDLRVEPLAPGASHTFLLLVDPPQGVARAHLVVDARTRNWVERLPAFVKIGALVAIAAMAVYLKFFD